MACKSQAAPLPHAWAETRVLKHDSYNKPEDDMEFRLTQQTADNHALGKYRFLPLATRDLDLIVSLDILFLRYDQPGQTLLQSGDIDNRLKTLFDALRKPRDLSETGGADPDQDENPFYVLLEDDSLITHLSVTTDLLLEPNKSVNDVRLIITVKTGPIVVNAYNLGLMGR